MSIDAASLDLSPPFIALQSTHVIESLLGYPITLLIFYVLYRALASRLGRVRSWYERVQQRLGRLFLLLVNLVIVSPLVATAWQAAFQQGITGAGSVLSEIGGLMGTLATVLVVYLIWLSFGPRRDVITEIRRRQMLPIALIFALYLLDALVATASGAAGDAELLMTGQADSSIAVDFTFARDVNQPLPATDLILVTTRAGVYYVVERQGMPPSGRPASWAIPFESVDGVQLQRVNEADVGLEEFMFEVMGTPTTP
jgi:hypothetical protein